MKVLVTGSGGYIGAVMCPILMAEGHEVVGLDTGFYDGCDFGPYEVEHPRIALDVRDVQPEHLAGFDAVVHLAALSNDPARMALLRSEAITIASLNHPNIATVYGLEESEGRHVLVLERVKGETLWQAQQRHGALPITEALRICVKVADALEAAHRRGIIHRDLKPRNLMLGPNGVVKVLDFGLAQVEDRVSTVPLDASSGTSGYMSPEQMRGEPQDLTLPAVERPLPSN